jgi:large subunit ribosomal protein L25
MSYATLDAERRMETGKSVTRKLRASGLIPAVFYSAKSDPIPLTIKNIDLEKALKQSKGGKELIELNLNDSGQILNKVTLIKEFQREVLSRAPIHVDFWEVDMAKELEVDVKIHLVGTPAGVEMGGVLEQIRREVTVSCRPSDLVEVAEVDVSGMEIGDTLHVMDIALPKGLTAVSDINFTIATVSAPTVAEEEVEEEELEEGEEEVEEEAAEEES